jgi:hypothetical protein
MFDGTIGIYKAYYTKSSREITRGSISCATFFASILILGFWGCVRKYKKKTGATKVTIREKSKKNQTRYEEEYGILPSYEISGSVS